MKTSKATPSSCARHGWRCTTSSPSLTVKYSKVQSNIDWLYSYDKNSISLKLERQF